jgi:hypothetical protein
MNNHYIIYYWVNNKYGTAFWISAKRAITAWHVLDIDANLTGDQMAGTADVHMRIRSGEFVGNTDWRVIGYDLDEDVAVLELRGAIPPVSPISVDWFEHNDNWWHCQKPHILGAVPSLDRADPGADPEYGGKECKMPDINWFLPEDGLSIVVSSPGTVFLGTAPPELQVTINGPRGGAKEYKGLSGSPLYVQGGNEKIALAVVLRYVDGGNDKGDFYCRKLSDFTLQWNPARQAVRSYNDGVKFLREFQIKDAQASLEASKRYFENDVGVECPGTVSLGLEHLQEANQLASGPSWKIWQLNQALNLLEETYYDITAGKTPDLWKNRFRRNLVIRMFTGCRPFS